MKAHDHDSITQRKTQQNNQSSVNYLWGVLNYAINVQISAVKRELIPRLRKRDSRKSRKSKSIRMIDCKVGWTAAAFPFKWTSQRLVFGQMTAHFYIVYRVENVSARKATIVMKFVLFNS